jgi:hypothetical protein
MAAHDYSFVHSTVIFSDISYHTLFVFASFPIKIIEAKQGNKSDHACPREQAAERR